MVIGHIELYQFPVPVQVVTSESMETAMALDKDICKNFVPTAISFP
jgi:signal peptidase I